MKIEKEKYIGDGTFRVRVEERPNGMIFMLEQYFPDVIESDAHGWRKCMFSSVIPTEKCEDEYAYYIASAHRSYDIAQHNAKR